ncbi:hypothetical protein NQT74_06880 [Alteromonas stellipolaris]|uniref:hypothetical protein n=1 Tax=Alteromonas stellipolaris TaxID=233316 RepID=UPI002117E076|nr:hypothetical protein [Alteromonas stellipolaris]MCQ8848297.1 hypothetical protein [Alteromonas stellipolaris]
MKTLFILIVGLLGGAAAMFVWNTNMQGEAAVEGVVAGSDDQFGYGHPLQSSESNNESLLTRVETKVDIHTNSNMDTHKTTTDGAAKQ